MSLRSKHHGKLKLSANNHAKNEIKQAQVKQFIQENEVCEYLTLYAKDVTNVVNHAGYNIDVGLEFAEEDKDRNTKRILAKLDPLTAEFVHALVKKVQFANKHMLKSFSLKVSLSEVMA